MSSSDSHTKEVRGPALVINRVEFGGAIALGVALIVVCLIVVGVWSHFETKNQAESFAVALTSLKSEAGLEPVSQHKAVLLKKDGVYNWRAIVWQATPAGRVPLIWSASVRKAEPMAVEHVEVVPYTEARAHELELFESVSTAKP